jgi:hypothetical protein
MNIRLESRPGVLPAVAVLAVAAALSLSACRGQKSEAPAAAAIETPAAPSEDLSVESLSAILGKAEAENSGVFESAKRNDELVVTYHFYEARKKGMDDRIGPDLAPKIQLLYRKFKSIDRVVFKVDVFERRDVIEWRPYCSFVTTRKIIDETNWTSLLLKDFFKVVLEMKYAE